MTLLCLRLARRRLQFALSLAATLLVCAGAHAEIRLMAPDVSERTAAAVENFEKGREHLNAEAYAPAAEYFERVVEAEPDYGVAWYQLGYCRLLLGDLEGSLPCWEHAYTHGPLRAESQYNRACTLALLGKVDAAFAALEASIQAGYREFEAIAVDDDLKSLRADERFAALVVPPEYPPSAGGIDVQFRSEGDWDVFGALYPAEVEDPKSAPCLLLFHQSGSNVGEYFPMAPRLAKAGFNCLSIDARGGSNSYGRTNRTVETHGDRGGGAEAYFDFLGALRYLDEQGYTGPRSLWGSSYSAGRLFAVLAEKPKRVVAALAFSPGRAFAREGENGEASWASRTSVPVFMCAPHWEYNPGARARFDTIASEHKWLYVPTEGGAHGSSMLRADRNPHGCEAAWEQTMAFLERYSR